MAAPKKRIILLLILPVIILLIPLVAMQFTSEVNWSITDFIIAALLLFGTAFGLDFLSRKINSRKIKVILAFLVLALFILIWIELAVGIFNSPFAGS